MGHLPPFIVFSLVVAVLLIYTHRKNIKRLKEGTESKIYIWKPRKVRLEEQERKARENETFEEVVEELVEEFREDNKEE